jgi:hypothetical protein
MIAKAITANTNNRPCDDDKDLENAKMTTATAVKTREDNGREGSDCGSGTRRKNVYFIVLLYMEM